jgi:5-methylcytosine-specific restriction protein A
MEHRNERDRYRGSASQRGYSSEWRRVRLQALKRDRYLCLHCLAYGRVNSAVDVDHITALSRGGQHLDLTNLQSLCRLCHRLKTVADNKQQ